MREPPTGAYRACRPGFGSIRSLNQALRSNPFPRPELAEGSPAAGSQQRLRSPGHDLGVPHFGPSSTALLILSVGLAVLLTARTIVPWDRGRLRIVRRVFGFGLSQAFLLLAMFIIANKQISFYASWSDLLGGV